MIELFEQDIKTDSRQSSKGNQLKWLNGNTWYKADYTGYEGLTEYVISGLLKKTSLLKQEFVQYNTEKILYGHVQYNGCKSENFLPVGWSLITLERLFKNMYNQSLQKSIYLIEDYENRIKFLVDQTVRMTGLKDFGKYMSMLLTLDTFFLNEDRHTHNIAVLMDENGDFHYCPVFDNGAALLSDTTMDYPLCGNMNQMLQSVSAKTFCRNFDEQLDIVEKLYGQQIQLSFTSKDIQLLLDEERYYPEEIKSRVFEILTERCRKYQYLFKK